MKSTVLVAALACAGSVHAQGSVTVYGVLDLGVWIQQKTPAAASARTNGGRLVSLNSGGLTPSVFGVRGEEVLGVSLKATFNLESHLDPSSGAIGLGVYWARAANVGLSGPWGTVKLGQQLNPAVLGYLVTDPRGMRESFSGTQPWATSSAQNTGPGSASPNNNLGFFASNAISYQLSVDAVSGGVAYSLGEVTGNQRKNRLLAGYLTYSGPVTVSTAYHESRWATTGELSDRKASLGAGFTTGPLNLKANYLHAKQYAQSGVTTGDWVIIGVGGDWALSAEDSVNAAVYRGKSRIGSDNAATSVVVGFEKNLSKRTTVYLQGAGIKAERNADFVVSLLGAQPVQGATTLVMNLGMRHRF